MHEILEINEMEENVKDAVTLLKTLSNEKRLMIICALNSGEKSVGELEKLVDIGQSALSQHLAKLRTNNLVSTRRDAQTIYYSLTDKATKELLYCLCNLFSKDKSCVIKEEDSLAS